MKYTLISFIFFLIGTGVSAQAQYKIKRYSAVVRTEQGKRYRGLLESVDDRGLTIRFHKNEKYIAADSIHTIRIKKYNAQNRSLLTGSLLGLAGGLAVYSIEKDKGNVNASILPVVIISSAVAGGGIAGIINSITAKEKFENLQQPNRFQQIRERLRQYALYK